MSKTTYCTPKQSAVLRQLGLSLERPAIESAAKFLREELGADLVVSPKFNSKTGDRIG